MVPSWSIRPHQLLDGVFGVEPRKMIHLFPPHFLDCVTVLPIAWAKTTDNAVVNGPSLRIRKIDIGADGNVIEALTQAIEAKKFLEYPFYNTETTELGMKSR